MPVIFLETAGYFSKAGGATLVICKVNEARLRNAGNRPGRSGNKIKIRFRMSQ